MSSTAHTQWGLVKDFVHRGCVRNAWREGMLKKVFEPLGWYTVPSKEVQWGRLSSFLKLFSRKLYLLPWNASGWQSNDTNCNWRRSISLDHCWWRSPGSRACVAPSADIQARPQSGTLNSSPLSGPTAASSVWTLKSFSHFLITGEGATENFDLFLCISLVLLPASLSWVQLPRPHLALQIYLFHLKFGPTYGKYKIFLPDAL